MYVLIFGPVQKLVELFQFDFVAVLSVSDSFWLLSIEDLFELKENENEIRTNTIDFKFMVMVMAPAVMFASDVKVST